MASSTPRFAPSPLRGTPHPGPLPCFRGLAEPGFLPFRAPLSRDARLLRPCLHGLAAGSAAIMSLSPAPLGWEIPAWCARFATCRRKAVKASDAAPPGLADPHGSACLGRDDRHPATPHGDGIPRKCDRFRRAVLRLAFMAHVPRSAFLHASHGRFFTARGMPQEGSRGIAPLQGLARRASSRDLLTPPGTALSLAFDASSSPRVQRTGPEVGPGSVPFRGVPPIRLHGRMARDLGRRAIWRSENVRLDSSPSHPLPRRSGRPECPLEVLAPTRSASRRCETPCAKDHRAGLLFLRLPSGPMRMAFRPTASPCRVRGPSSPGTSLDAGLSLPVKARQQDHLLRGSSIPGNLFSKTRCSRQRP